MAVGGSQLKSIDALEVIDDSGRRLIKNVPSLKRVQHDALEQIPQGEVEVLGERLEHLQEGRLDAHPGLNSRDCYHGTKITVTSVTCGVGPGRYCQVAYSLIRLTEWLTIRSRLSHTRSAVASLSGSPPGLRLSVRSPPAS